MITDARDYLDEKGALAPLKGAALQLAEFHGAVISWATDYEEIGLLPQPDRQDAIARASCGGNGPPVEPSPPSNCLILLFRSSSSSG